MSGALAVDLEIKEPEGRNLSLAGPETEATKRQSTETFHTNLIVFNLPEDPSDSDVGKRFSVSRS